MSKFINIQGVIINTKHIVMVTYSGKSKLVITCTNRVVSITEKELIVTNKKQVRLSRECNTNLEELHE